MQNSVGLCRPLCRTVWGCGGLCAEQCGAMQAYVQNSVGLAVQAFVQNSVGLAVQAFVS